MKKLGLDLSGKNDRNAFAVAVAIALIVASALLVAYYAWLLPTKENYTNIYLLDMNRKAADYPELLVANVNSTFNVYVVVENHLGRALENVEVRLKIANDTNPTFPLSIDTSQTFDGTVQDGAKWENQATVSLNEPGSYLVAFELWTPGESGALGYSGNVVALNIQVIQEST